jgi:pimeloyl-ACP methyl ester carboxylesterase
MNDAARVQPRWHRVERDGTSLACADYGGTGTPAVLLHGLAGHATEWNETASWLATTHHVFAPDLRGHGRSERCPDDVSRQAHVTDVEAWIEQLGLAPVALVGQSLGGHTAFLVAARRPGLVEKLVVAEAGPGPCAANAAPSGDDQTAARVREWLESWPTPFVSREVAAAFFGRNNTWAQAWADGLEQRVDGLYPRFDVDVMVAALKGAAGSFWSEWRAIECPTLVVVAKDRENPELAHRMLAEQPRASLVEIPDAGHDLHLDNPAAWREALEAFLSQPVR